MGNYTASQWTGFSDGAKLSNSPEKEVLELESQLALSTDQGPVVCSEVTHS
jgi:hypothetical protein